MKDKLNKIREPEEASMASGIIASILFAVIGIAVGAAVCWINYMADHSTVWWQDIVGDLQLNTVFSRFPIWFLMGLCVAVWSYHPIKAAINEIAFFVGVTAGHMIAPKVIPGLEGASGGGTKWLLIGVIAAALAVVIWYAKSKSWPSIAFDAVIIGLLGAYCFDIGFVYFHFNDLIIDLINVLIVFLVVVVLGSGLIQFLVSLLGGALIALILSPLFH